MNVIEKLKRAVSKLAELYARFVIFLIGKEVSLSLLKGTGDRGESLIGVFDQYSGICYGSWEVVIHEEAGIVEATFRGFGKPRNRKKSRFFFR